MIGLKRILGGKVFFWIVKITPFIVTALVVLRVFAGGDFSVDRVLSYCPESYLFAGAVLLLMYALKSLSVIFPVSVLYIAAGFIFDPVSAVFVTAAGLFISLSIPYFIGFYSNPGLAAKIVARFEPLTARVNYVRESPVFFSFFLRIIRIMPMDTVSRFLGAEKLNYIPYITASMSGVLPGAVLTVLMGGSIDSPSSPVFITFILLSLLISAVSLLIYNLLRRGLSN